MYIVPISLWFAENIQRIIQDIYSTTFTFLTKIKAVMYFNRRLYSLASTKRASIWLMSGLAVIVVLSALSLLLAQKYISREHVKKEILNYLSARIAGKFDFESIDFQFFHRPRVEIRDGSFSIPGEADGTFETLTVYPRVLPLLTGHVEIDSIEIVKPVVRLTVPEAAGQERAAAPLSLHATLRH